jgi:mono/diheme cytochrome c family protein
MKTLTRKLALCFVLLLCIPSSGCLEWWPEFGIPAGKEPWGEWNPAQYIFYSMHNSPAIEDQEKGMLQPPPGTVPTDSRPYPFAPNEAARAEALTNPIPPTTASLQYGQLQYETTCIVCHGADGKGHGYVVPPFPQPPDLTAQRVRSWPDGRIYHVIVNGQGRMWSYKNQLSEMERWAVINYIRALQRAAYPEPEDLERVSD